MRSGIHPRPVARVWFFVIAFFGNALVLPTMAVEPFVREFDVVVRDGKIGRELSRLRVTEGDHVIMRWSSNDRATVHLEGYEIAIEIGRRRPGTIELDVLITGRFPIHIHTFDGHGNASPQRSRHGASSYLEVYPQ